MKIDHIGYAVKRLDRALASFEMLGFQFGPITDDPDRNIRIAFGTNGELKIELVSPLDRTQASPVDTLICKIGPTPYHICYGSGQLDEDVAALTRKGFKVTVPPAKALAFGGRRVVFMMDLGLGLIEIVEE